MPELSLDHHERHALVCHLNGMGMPELMGREAPADTCREGGMVQLLAGCGCFPVAPGGRAVDHAKERANGQLVPNLEPWFEF